MLKRKVFKPVGQDEAYSKAVSGDWQARRAKRQAEVSF
jgi:hypothetical protein